MSKRLLYKQKYEEDEKAAAHVFQDFIKTFHTNTHPNKVFIKSVTLNAKSDLEANLESGRIYKPAPIVPQCSSSAVRKALECAKLVRDDMCVKSSKGAEKPKSNLDSLKEELKQRHSERILRKNSVNADEVIKPSGNTASTIDNNCMTERVVDEVDLPCRTTNLFINNLRPTMSENELMVLFGEYGPLASVKIMWPRNNIIINSNNVDDDDRRNNANCGFVAFMSRKDSERALEHMTNNSDMRISWGRPVDLPSFPIYIPPRYQQVLMPAPNTGLPFNAQPFKSKRITTFHQQDGFQELLYNSRVIVSLPLDKKQISTIHRMVEFVVREGPLFEAMIMNRELKNPLFQFLFENTSPAHAYYRWKLYSIAHGESTTHWSKTEFRMFHGGAIWVPPIVPNFTLGMPDYLYDSSALATTSDLSIAQQTRLIQFIQDVRMTQPSIRDVTMYCLKHASAARTIIDIICTSLLNTATNPTYKIARLYLLSDILHNVWRGKAGHHFLTALERYLDEVVDSLEGAHWRLRFAHDRFQLKTRVQRVLRAWAGWGMFTRERVVNWRRKFEEEKGDSGEDCDNEAIDGPMDGQRLRELSNSNTTDYDHISIDEAEIAIDETKLGFASQNRDFVTSKWEVVDPVEIKANAMSTKRLFVLENNRLEDEKNNSYQNAKARNTSELSLKSSKYSPDSLRSKLREIEVQVLHFQDDLESGYIKTKRGRKPDEEILNYRRKLMKKLALES